MSHRRLTRNLGVLTPQATEKAFIDERNVFVRLQSPMPLGG